MARQKGNVALRLSGEAGDMVATVVYRGPLGKRTLKHLGTFDCRHEQEKKDLQKALEKAYGIWDGPHAPEEV